VSSIALVQVLSNVAQRMADMHAAGYVHRDLKPANVMWLPRENRWTVIDFGCAARIGEVAPLSFTLAYAAPEVMAAFEQDQRWIASSEALDAWSLGIMAYELLTGAPAFRLLTDGRCKVRCMRSQHDARCTCMQPPVPAQAQQQLFMHALVRCTGGGAQRGCSCTRMLAPGHAYRPALPYVT
jgi:serine/threonine protein kinase